MTKCKHLRLESTPKKVKCLDCNYSDNRRKTKSEDLIYKSTVFRFISHSDKTIDEDYWPNGDDETRFGERIIVHL